VVVRALVDFCTVDLSAVYLDVRKDRLYCDLEAPRRQSQTVLYAALRALTALSAPVLCFTAEEIWSHMPRLERDPSSVHLALFPDGFAADPAIAGVLGALLEWRAAVQQALESFRAQKKDSLDAEVLLPARHLAALAAHPVLAGEADAAAWLADLFIVSRVGGYDGEAGPAASGLPPLSSAEVRVGDAAGHRCARCWKLRPESPVCARCSAALAEAGGGPPGPGGSPGAAAGAP